jgi:iron(III) transport system permease protein
MRVASKRPRSQSHYRRATPPLLSIAGWVTTLVFAAPFVYLAWETTRLGNFFDVLGRSDVTGPLLRSLALASATSALATFIGGWLAWLIVRTDLPGRRIFGVAVALPLVIPSYVAAASLRAAFGPGSLIGWVPRPSGFLGALLVLTAVTYPYVYLPVAARLRTMPASLEDAARSLGDTGMAVVRRVVIPQARTALVGGSLIVALYTMSDFGAVSLLRYDTMTRAIFASRLAAPETALALGLTLSLVALAVASVTRKTSQTPGTAPNAAQMRVYSVGKYRNWLIAAVLALVTLALVAPIGVFVVWWLRGGQGVVDSFAALRDPAVHSALAGLTAGGAAMILLLPAAYLVARRTSRTAAAVDLMVAATFALPGLVLALAVVYWVLRTPGPIAGLYQSFPLLIIAYLVHFGVQSHRSTTAAVQAIPPQYGEAARMLGSGPIRRFITVDVPLISPGVIAGGGLVMLSTMKELPATLLLAPLGFDTLATRVWGAAADGFLADTGIASLALVAISALLTWILVLRPAQLVAPLQSASRPAE